MLGVRHKHVIFTQLSDFVSKDKVIVLSYLRVWHAFHELEQLDRFSELLSMNIIYHSIVAILKILSSVTLTAAVVRVRGCSPRGTGFDSRRRRIFWVFVGLEQCPLSLVKINEGLHERKNSGSGLENQDYRPWGTAALTRWHPSICKSWH
jgi:hypothetical protein